jgi:hypothetical protein
MSKAQLNSDIIGPENDEYDRIEAASNIIGEKIGKLASDHGYKLWWSWGDSNAWRVIVGIPTETEFAQLTSTGADTELARKIVSLIGSTVELNEGFKLYMELDTDERVNANEGWFFRIKSEPSREQVFVWSEGELSRA